MSPRKWTSPQLLSTSAAAQRSTPSAVFELARQLRIRPVGFSALPRQVDSRKRGRPARRADRPAVDRRAVERPQGLAGIPDHGVAIVGEKPELALARRGTRALCERDTGVRPEARRRALLRCGLRLHARLDRSRSRQGAERTEQRGHRSPGSLELRATSSARVEHRAWPAPIARRSGTGDRCRQELCAHRASPGIARSATTSPCSSRSLTTNFRPGGAAALRRNSEELVGSRSTSELDAGLVALLAAPRAPARRSAAVPAIERRRRERPGRDADAVPTRELGRAISEGVGTGADRLVTEVAPDVGRERFHGRIAFGRVLLQSLRDDRVEISAELPAQALPRRGSRRASESVATSDGRFGCRVHDRLKQERG